MREVPYEADLLNRVQQLSMSLGTAWVFFNPGNRQVNGRGVPESLIVMLSLPFALVGGIWLMYFLDYDMRVAVGGGFIRTEDR